MNLNFNNDEMHIFIHKYVSPLAPDCPFCTWSAFRPEKCDYIELVFSCIYNEEDCQDFDSSKYRIHDTIVTDPKALLIHEFGKDELYLVYKIAHLYDEATGNYYHSAAELIAAKGFSDDDETPPEFEFQCCFYMTKDGKCGIHLDGTLTDAMLYTDDYEEPYTEAVWCKFAVFTCQQMKTDMPEITFNGKYHLIDFEPSGLTALLMFCDGIDEAVEGSRFAFLDLHDCSVGENGEEFDQGDNFYTGIEFLF